MSDDRIPAKAALVALLIVGFWAGSARADDTPKILSTDPIRARIQEFCAAHQGASCLMFQRDIWKCYSLAQDAETTLYAMRQHRTLHLTKSQLATLFPGREWIIEVPDDVTPTDFGNQYVEKCAQQEFDEQSR